jgi:hypothetical protein
MLKHVAVTRAHLEIPIEDFEGLTRELGCSLHRGARDLTLAGAHDNALEFELAGEVATLKQVRISHDPHGHFCRDVLGLLAQVYGGDVDAELEWAPSGAAESHLSIVGGDTSHPLLFQPPETLEQVEQWLADAKRWWDEYQRLTQAALEPQPESGKSRR